MPITSLLWTGVVILISTLLLPPTTSSLRYSAFSTPSAWGRHAPTPTLAPARPIHVVSTLPFFTISDFSAWPPVFFEAGPKCTSPSPILVSMTRVVPTTSTCSTTPLALSRFTASHSTGPCAQHSSMIFALPAFSSTSVMSRLEKREPCRCLMSDGVIGLVIYDQTSKCSPGFSMTILAFEDFSASFLNSLGSCSIEGHVP
jgi:hypothetical protein